MFKILPGLSICILIAVISKILGNYIPTIGASSISLFIGLLVGNTISFLDSQPCQLLSLRFSRCGYSPYKRTTSCVFRSKLLSSLLLIPLHGFLEIKLAPGTKFAESSLLSYSIVLLGGTLSLQSILSIGMNGVIFIAMQMIITIAFSLFLGKRLGFSEDYRFLMASGNAVCGSSAIAATAPA